MTDKILKKYIYEGFGFPVVLCNIPTRQIRGEWVPFINYIELAKHVMRVLCFVQEPLTGNQVFFIRQQIRLTGQELARVLGITQAAISKWEKKKNEVAKIEPAIEFCLRFIALEHLDKGGFDNLRKLFLQKHLLLDIKEKQKDAEFSPTPLKIMDGDLYILGSAHSFINKVDRRA
jgi:transcriptional regulator with XRE-family HTH domain